MRRLFLILILFFFISGLVIHTGCKKSDIGPDSLLQGIKWILESIQYSEQNVVPIQETYYILFNEDLTLEMQVDCNFCTGTYELGGNNSLSFTDQMACTDAYCGDDSRDTEFHAAIGTASRYDVNGNRLRIYFSNEQSHLNFIAESSTF